MSAPPELPPAEMPRDGAPRESLAIDDFLPADDVAVHLDCVSHRYQGRKALDHVSFQVPRGALHGFVGPNGAGKTTSLKLICTLLQPQVGVVRVFGRDVVEYIREVRQKIGFMPDHFSTYRQMSVFEYLDFFAAAYGLPFKKRGEVIEQVLSLVDMQHRQKDHISGLSRGMQQRVGLARVLINDPELLLLDEPASGLDPRARIELMEILKALRAMGKTIFISSHILSELAELCSSVTIIDRGQIRFSGTMDRLLKRSDTHPAFRVTVGGDVPELAEQLRQVPGVAQAEPSAEQPNVWRLLCESGMTPNDLLRALIERGVPIAAFEEDRRQLNEAFMDLTSGGVR